MIATIALVLRVGLAIVLYYFLWRVFQTLWQDLNHQGIILSFRRKPGIQVNAVMNDGRELKFNFRQTEIGIGRGSHCDINLKDEALSVEHARLSHHHGQWWLEDMASTNGTFLNKDQVTTPTVVINGDQFTCGNISFTLRIDEPHNNHSTRETGTGIGGIE